MECQFSYPFSKLLPAKLLRFGAICLIFLPLDLFAAQEVPQGFTFQGRFLNQAGTASLTTTVNVKLSILSPSGSCLLYEEQQNNIDLSQTDGFFALSVGSFVGDPKRTVSDPALALSKVFLNQGSIRADDSGSTHTCVGGYSPNAGDTRRLRVTITPSAGGASTVLSPDQTINSVPNAVNAQTLQGYLPNSFILSSGNVTQTNLDSLTGGTDIGGTLHNHDSLYLKIGGSSSQNFGSGISYSTGQFGVGTSSPSGKIEVDTGAAAVVGEIVKGAASQTADLFQVQKSDGTILSKFDSAGFLTLPGDPTSALQACTKNYVDTTTLANTNLTTTGAVPYVSASGVVSQDASNFFWNSTNHRLGIGTTTPTAMIQIKPPSGSVGLSVDYVGGTTNLLTVNGTSAVVKVDSSGGFSATGCGVIGTATAPCTGSGFIADSGTGGRNTVLALGHFSQTAAIIVSRQGSGGTGNLQEWQSSASAALSVMNSTGALALGATSVTASQKLDVIGNTRVQGGLCVISGAGVGNCDGTAGKIWASTTAIGSADLAEHMPVEDETLRAGDVVAVEPSKDALEGIFAKTKTAFQSTAIGVISTEPGVALGSATKNSRPVALAGRVPVNVTLEGGVIEVGDYLVASNEPGKAMKASSTDRGGVIGIALSRYDGKPANGPEMKDGVAQPEGAQVMLLVQAANPSSKATRALAGAVDSLKKETSALKKWACSQPNRPEALCHP